MDHGRPGDGTGNTPQIVATARTHHRTHPREPCRVLMIGMMGTGKTTIGHRLAEMTGWPYVDNDDLVADVAGLPPDQLLLQRGVDALRDAESEALRIAVRTPVPLVASVAGGVVTSAEDRARVRSGGFVVWLREPIAVLVKRVARGPARPWLGDDPYGAMAKLYRGREPLYAETATIVVDGNGRRPRAIAEEILAALDRHCAAHG